MTEVEIYLNEDREHMFTEQEDEVSANIEKDPLFYRWVDPNNHGLEIVQ